MPTSYTNVQAVVDHARAALDERRSVFRNTVRVLAAEDQRIILMTNPGFTPEARAVLQGIYGHAATEASTQEDVEFARAASQILERGRVADSGLPDGGRMAVAQFCEAAVMFVAAAHALDIAEAYAR